MAQQKTQVSKSGIDFFYDTNSKLRLLSDAGRLYSISGSTISEGNKLVIQSDLSSSSVNNAKFADGLGTSTAYYSYQGLASALDSKLNKNLMPEATAGNKGYYITTDGTKYIWRDLSLSVMDLPRPFTSGYLLSNNGTDLSWKAPYSLPKATDSVLGGIKVSTGLSIDADGKLSVSYGNTSTTACVGNDSRLSDSREAKDVYPWAKESTKPKYIFTEVGIPEVTNQSGKILSNNGTSLSWIDEYSYTLPTATDSVLGGIKVGTGLGITDSVLSVSYGSSSGTSCQGNDSRLSDKRITKNSLTISLNGTSQGDWDGSSAKSINITPSNIGAALSSHDHALSNITDFPEINSTTNNKVLSNNGTSLTWKTEYSYTLPTATSSALGGIKVGTGLGITNSVLSVNYGDTETTACIGNDSRLSDSRICPNGLSISTNGTSKLSGWNGSTASSIDINYSDVGASESDHVHGNLTNDGKIGSSANRFIVTTTDGVLTSSSDSLYVSDSNIYSTGFYVTSSRSKKHDIKISNINALDIINSIDIVEFKYNNDPEDRLRIGLIAEDSPELVVTNKTDAMDSGNVLGLLLKAVQELNNKLSARYL